eukprot:1147873-Pelagomonas_calceolata.AAC.2
MSGDLTAGMLLQNAQSLPLLFSTMARQQLARPEVPSRWAACLALIIAVYLLSGWQLNLYAKS